jgi:hypothetical protein
MTAALSYYADIILQLREPLSRIQLSERWGRHPKDNRLGRILQAMRRLGLVHTHSWYVHGHRGVAHRVFASGPGAEAPYPGTTARGRPRRERPATRRHANPNLLAFAEVWIALADGATLREMSAASGLHTTAIGKLVRHLRSRGAARISGWEGRQPIYALGSGADAARTARDRAMAYGLRAPYADVARAFA